MLDIDIIYEIFIQNEYIYGLSINNTQLLTIDNFIITIDNNKNYNKLDFNINNIYKIIKFYSKFDNLHIIENNNKFNIEYYKVIDFTVNNWLETYKLLKYIYMI